MVVLNEGGPTDRLFNRKFNQEDPSWQKWRNVRNDVFRKVARAELREIFGKEGVETMTDTQLFEALTEAQRLGILAALDNTYPSVASFESMRPARG